MVMHVHKERTDGLDLRVLVRDLGEFLMKLQEARRNHRDEVTPNPNWQNLDQMWVEIP